MPPPVRWLTGVCLHAGLILERTPQQDQQAVYLAMVALFRLFDRLLYQVVAQHIAQMNPGS